MPEKLPAALLLHGQRGIGKHLLAQALAKRFLCAEAAVGKEACGRCESCHLFDVGNHPDFRLLQPAADAETETAGDAQRASKSKKPSKQIQVDAVRELAGLTSTVSHRGGARVAMITPAEALNPAAANALLKMLEEPGQDTYLILVAGDVHRLLPTIKSRCFKIPVRVPVAQKGAAWLAEQQAGHAEAALFLASQAPLAALKLSADDDFWTSRSDLMTCLANPSTSALEAAAVAEKLEAPVLGRLLAMWVFDVLALQHGGEVHYNRDKAAEIRNAASRVPGRELCRWSDAVRDFTRSADHPLNRRLALEALFAGFPVARS